MVMKKKINIKISIITIKTLVQRYNINAEPIKIMIDIQIFVLNIITKFNKG